MMMVMMMKMKMMKMKMIKNNKMMFIMAAIVTMMMMMMMISQSAQLEHSHGSRRRHVLLNCKHSLCMWVVATSTFNETSWPYAEATAQRTQHP